MFTSVYDKSDLKSNKLFYKKNYNNINVFVVNINVSNKHNIALRAITFILYTLFSTIYALIKKHDIVIASSGPLSVAIPWPCLKIFRRKKLIFEVRDIFADGLEQLEIIKNKYFLNILSDRLKIMFMISPTVLWSYLNQ